MDEETQAILKTVSKRNPGGLDVCFKLLDYLKELVVFDFEVCLRDNILGSDLWDLYQYCCDRDIAKVHASLMQGTAPLLLQSIKGSSFYVATEEA